MIKARYCMVALLLIAPLSLWASDEEVAYPLFKLSIEELMNVRVSAQKRLEPLQQVPASLYHFSAAQLSTSDSFRTEELARIAPSLAYDKRIDFTKSSMKIRGIGTLVFGAGVEPSVATLVDGVVMARGGAGFFELYDLESVEILLGPQSTLFGKNASAGLIHVKSHKPQLYKSYGEANAWLTDDQDYRLELMANQGINQHWATRFSAVVRSFEGNVDNRYDGNTLNGIDASALRAQVKWQGDNTSLLLALDYSRQDSTQGVRVLRVDSDSIFTDPAAIGSSGIPATAGQITGITAGADNTQVNLNRKPLVESEAYGANLHLQWAWKGHQWHSISAVRRWIQENDRDNDQTQLDFSLKQLENRDVSWYSQEFRLNSHRRSALSYVLGLYYSHSENIDTSGDERTFSNADYIFELNQADNRIINENTALFGQLDWQFMPRWQASLGLRWLYDRVEATLSRQAFTQNNAFLDDGQITANRDVAAINNSEHFSRMIGKAALQYTLSDTISSYISYARGFKGAAFNTSFKFDAQVFVDAEPVAPEESHSLEWGVRSQWQENHQFNVTLFYTRYDGLQLTMRDLENNRNIIGSVKHVVSKGLELSYTALVLDDWLIQLHYSYLDAYYQDFSNANCYAHQTEEQGCVSLTGGNVQDLSGETLVNAPKHRSVLAVSYPWQWRAYSLTWDNQLRAQSAVNLDSAGNPNAQQSGYGIWDMGLSLQSPGHNWTARIYVKNLLDRQYVNGITINGNAGGDLVMQLIPRDFERYMGISFKLNI